MKNPNNNPEIMDDLNTDDLFIEADMREEAKQDAIQEEACLDPEMDYHNWLTETVTGFSENIWWGSPLSPSYPCTDVWGFFNGGGSVQTVSDAIGVPSRNPLAKYAGKKSPIYPRQKHPPPNSQWHMGGLQIEKITPAKNLT